MLVGGRRNQRKAARRTRVVRLAATLLTLTSFILVPAVRAGAALPTKPNIVLIVTDDQRTVDLSVMPLTQSLLANHGVTFTNAFVTTSACCPSRSSMLTGQYSHNTGVYDNVPPNGGAGAFKDSSTLATWLRGAGYSTSLIGKYLNGYETLSSKTYIPPGWSDWHALAAGTKNPIYYNYTLNENGVLRSFGSAPGDYLTDVLADRAYQFVRSAPGPFFLDFAPFSPHWPAVPGPNDPIPTTPLAKPPSFNEADVSDKPWGSTVPLLGTKEINGLTSYFRASLAALQSVDRAVAKIVQGLQERGVLENTVIAFISDNGMLHGEHRIWNKVWAYDPSVRVPLVIRVPGAENAQKRTDSRFVTNLDLTATFAELAGVTPPLKQNGVSLVPLLNQQTVSSWRTGVYMEWLGGKTDVWTPVKFGAFRTSQYKLIIYQNGTRELYDMNADPHELNNLAKNPAYDAAEAQVEVLLKQQAAA